MTYNPSIIDLSRVPIPDAIETYSVEAMIAQFVARFKLGWDAARIKDPTLPPWDVDPLEVDPVVVVGEAWSDGRMRDRERVNDAVKATLATTASGTDLDAIAASANVIRLVLVPADPILQTAEVKESDTSLLRRYLLAFDKPAAGSVGRYLYEAWTAWPLMGDIDVIGRVVHGRPGDTDIVISGPAGRDATVAEMATLRAAILNPNVQPEAVGVTLIRAKRVEYTISLLAEILTGSGTDLVIAEAVKRVRAQTDERTKIGAEVPADLVQGAAYGPNVVKVTRLLPLVSIEPDPYSVPVCTGITIVPA